MSLNSKVLVTGGAGFIGSNLAEELINQGAKVNIIDSLITGFRENLEEINGDFEFIEGDLNDDDKLKQALEGVEIVFHQAALPSVPRSVDNPHRLWQRRSAQTPRRLAQGKSRRTVHRPPQTTRSRAS